MSLIETEARDVDFPSGDGVRLRARFWAASRPRGSLVISHGMGEHGGCYARLARDLVGRPGVDVLAFDYRGAGRSPGRRGVVRAYSDLSLDLIVALDWMARERPDSPRFLLGHSNGGLVALRTLIESGGDFGLSGLIASNPPLRLSAHVPAWKVRLGEFLLRVAPGVTLSTGLDNERLTRDPEMLAEIDADPLRHDRISPPLYFGMAAAGPMAIERAGGIALPTLLILGGADPIIDPGAGRLFFDRLGSADKTLKVYDGMRHEPINELGRDEVVADIAGWIDARLKDG